MKTKQSQRRELTKAADARRWKMRAFGIAIGLAIVFLIFGLFGAIVYGQTPPVSTVEIPADTVRTLDLEIPVTVESSIPWDLAGGVGVYYSIPDLIEGWLYARGGFDIPFAWTAPVGDCWIFFASQVEDNEGNREAYPQEIGAGAAEDSVFVCLTCPPRAPARPDSIGATPLQAIQFLVAEGFRMEADTPALEYYWPEFADPADSVGHLPAVKYKAEWEVDGVVSIFPDIPVQEDGRGILEVPYMEGSTQRLRVYGIDVLDRESPPSVWSDPWTDDGPPPEPGAPARRLIMIGG